MENTGKRTKSSRNVVHRLGIVHLRELVAKVNGATNRDWTVTRFSQGYAIRQDGDASYVSSNMTAKESESLLEGVLLGVKLGGQS